MASDTTKQVADYFHDLQDRLVKELARLDGSKFTERAWKSKLGTGIGLLREGGEVFERAGVSMSQISADQLPAAASAARPELAGKPYEAMGVSVVCHPRNPFAPTAHLNVRFFTTTGDGPAWWFGGGMDLSPHFGFDEDCRHFHRTCADALAPHSEGKDLYEQFKHNCDEYFFIKHRGQMRGIGGVFFDDYSAGGFEKAFAMTRSVGDAFALAYVPLVEKRAAMEAGDSHRSHQLYRRGRYVEFNLVQDRGTLFGLQSGGQADAILMSMPPLASWDSTAPGRDPTDDEKLTEYLKPRSWLA